MSTIAWEVHLDQTCECEYQITTFNNDNILVIKQTHNSTTSITNKIETIVSKILTSDLSGKHPDNIRIFEYYPLCLNPLEQWQEVKFKNAYEIDSNISLIDTFKQLFVRRQKATNWAVCDPVWSLVLNENLKSKLNILTIN